MKPKRYFFVLCGIFGLLCLAIIAVVFFGNSLLVKQSKQLSDQKVQNKAAEQQQLALSKAKKDIEKYKDLNTIARAIVPQDKDQAKTVREIAKIAESSGIKLRAFTFQTSNLGQTTTPAPAPTDGAATTPATPATPPLSQVKPVEGIPGVYSLEITVSPADNQPIPYQNFLAFLEKLEGNRRTAHVDKISVTPTANGITFSLTLKAYVKP